MPVMFSVSAMDIADAGWGGQVASPFATVPYELGTATPAFLAAILMVVAAITALGGIVIWWFKPTVQRVRDNTQETAAQWAEQVRFVRTEYLPALGAGPMAYDLWESYVNGIKKLPLQPRYAQMGLDVQRHWLNAMAERAVEAERHQMRRSDNDDDFWV